MAVLEDDSRSGGVAQLEEHLACTEKVAGSIPVTSTNSIESFLSADQESIEKLIEKPRAGKLNSQGSSTQDEAGKRGGRMATQEWMKQDFIPR